MLHLFYRVRAEHVTPETRTRILDAVRTLEADDHQALLVAVLGSKADLAVMALGPNLVRLQQFQHEMAALGALEPTSSYVSLTELSEYTTTEDQERARLERDEQLSGAALDEKLGVWRERIAHYNENRLHPRLPLRPVWCFYPMSKRRDGADNWYALPFEERRRIMGGHARVGRTYAGRVLQLITGSTGLDDWEWGVTLLADEPDALKDIVYEMRYDEASTRYADFGPFYTGLLAEPAVTLARVGITDPKAI